MKFTTFSVSAVFVGVLAVAAIGTTIVGNSSNQQNKASLLEDLQLASVFETQTSGGEVISATATSEVGMISNNLTVTIPAGTVITARDGNSFDPSQLRAEGANFGIDGREIVFSQPVVVVFAVPSVPDGTEVTIGGGGSITTQPIANCDNGVAPSDNATGVITDGKITIYACAV